MMYSQKFVVAVKQNGKIMREEGDVVRLPFGSEYSVLLKNLNSVRAKASVYIDGQPAIESMVLNGGQSVDLERFVKDLNKGNRFKFIERTQEIEQHRGIKAEDGLIRVEFKFEKPLPITIPVIHEHHYYHDYNPWKYNHYGWQSNTLIGSNATYTTSNTSGTYSNSSVVRGMQANVMKSAEGITVPGSESNQKFHLVSDFATEEQSQVIVLRLVGGSPVSTHEKLGCQTCGKKNKSSSKFCSRCGTALLIL